MHQFKVNEGGEHKEINTGCAICLGEFEEGEWLKHLPNCSHGFHGSISLRKIEKGDLNNELYILKLEPPPKTTTPVSAPINDIVKVNFCQFDL
ncbi:hypothetical protein HN51_044036 [Arachis hypogaea]